MSRPKNDEFDLMIQAAWQYYVHGRGQEKIAQSLDLSRTKVNRLLSQARDNGLVKISVNHEMAETLALSDWISEHYGVDNCVLTPPMPEKDDTSPALEQIARQAVGLAAANILVRRCLASGSITVGVGGGRTVRDTLESIATLRKSDLVTLALVGTTLVDDGTSAYSLALSLATSTGGEAQTLPVPIYVGSAETCAVLRADPLINRILEQTARTDLNLLSCGPATAIASFSQRARLDPAEIAALEKAGAVCEIGGLFLAADGSEVRTSLSDRRLGVELEALRGADNIVVAAGSRKAEPLKAVMAAGLARTIVIDHAVAEKLTQSISKPKQPAQA